MAPGPLLAVVQHVRPRGTERDIKGSQGDVACSSLAEMHVPLAVHDCDTEQLLVNECGQSSPCLALQPWLPSTSDLVLG